MLVHSVYFWLKADLSAADRETFRQEIQKLQDLKSAKKVYVGPPAPTPKRPIIESSYDYALIVFLDDMAAHDAYQVEPGHKAFVAKCSPMWQRLQIFDADACSRSAG